MAGWIGNSPFQGIREERWVRRRGQKQSFEGQERRIKRKNCYWREFSSILTGSKEGASMTLSGRTHSVAAVGMKLDLFYNFSADPVNVPPILVSFSWIRWPMLVLCSAMADSYRYGSCNPWPCLQWNSQSVQCKPITHAGDAINKWCFKNWSSLTGWRNIQLTMATVIERWI
jgi:hypothetical protein